MISVGVDVSKGKSTVCVMKQEGEMLVEKGIFVCCINALCMKKCCSQSIRRAKTDKIDSLRIASYGIAYWSELSPFLTATDTYRELKLLARQYYQTTSMLNKAKVNSINLLDQTMPSIQEILQDNSCNNKLTDFVKRYFHYSHILSMGKPEFLTDTTNEKNKDTICANVRLKKSSP